MKPALATFGAVLQQAASGLATPLDLRSAEGQTLVSMDAADWSGAPRPGDESLLDACSKATLDVGCGPGRLVKELGLRGLPALGIDISSEAIMQAHSRGAAARLCDVFQDVPDVGWWGHVILADGNIGIGGDPVRLLRRCGKLLRHHGTLIAELGEPGSPSWSHPVQLHHNGIASPPFWWAALSVTALPAVASRAGLSIQRQWTTAQRWFAELSTSDEGAST